MMSFSSKKFKALHSEHIPIADTFFQEISCGVPQRSILGPLLFNIDLSDLFFIMDQYGTVSYADDNTPYVQYLEKTFMGLSNVRRSIISYF